MHNLKRLVIILIVSLFVAAGLSLGWSSRRTVSVPAGFVFGQPLLQQKMPVAGSYSVERWGFPSTYRETERFRSTTGPPYETTFDSKSFSLPLVLTNIAFWMSLLTALLAPSTILFRRNAIQMTEPSSRLSDKKEQKVVDAHPRD